MTKKKGISMKSLRVSALSITLLTFLLLIASVPAFGQSDLNLWLISQLEEEDPAIPNQAEYQKLSTWKDQHVKDLKITSQEDMPGQYQGRYEFSPAGNPETISGTYSSLSREFYYNEDGDLAKVEEYAGSKLRGQSHFYYTGKGELLKAVIKEWATSNEREIMYDKQGNPTQIMWFKDGTVTELTKIENQYDNLGRLTASISKEEKRLYRYDPEGRLIEYKWQKGKSDYMTELVYKNESITKMKTFKMISGGYSQQYESSWIWDEEKGVVSRISTVYRDANIMPSAQDYKYEDYWTLLATRGDDAEAASYGTPLMIRWIDPRHDMRTTNNKSTLRLEMVPGEGQEMPKVEKLWMRVNGELTDEYTGEVIYKPITEELLSVSETVKLKEGENSVVLIVQTNLGKFKSRERYINFRNPQKVVPVRNLNVLTIGVSDYILDTFDLDYAAQDAKDLAAKMATQEGKTFEKVNVTTLVNDAATKKNIMEAVENLRRITAPGDVAMIYFAGHGQEYYDNYYLKPYDVDLEEDRLESTAIHNRELVKQINRFKSHVVFMYDASKGDEEVFGTNDLRPLRRDFDEVMIEDDNLRWFVSAAREGRSADNSDWSNSAFAESIIEGLNGDADKRGNNDGITTFDELDEFATWKCVVLTEGKQVPTSIKKGVGLLPVTKK